MFVIFRSKFEFQFEENTISSQIGKLNMGVSEIFNFGETKKLLEVDAFFLKASGALMAMTSLVISAYLFILEQKVGKVDCTVPNDGVTTAIIFNSDCISGRLFYENRDEDYLSEDPERKGESPEFQ